MFAFSNPLASLSARLLALVASAAIVGCASTSPPTASNTGAATTTASSNDAASHAPAVEGVPDVDMNGALLYRIMAAEVAAQRGEPGPAFATYVAIAKETGDARLARRATELALQARAFPEALSGAVLWKSLAPHSAEATQTLAALYMSLGRFDDAAPLLAAAIKASASPADELTRLQRQLARVPDKAGGFKMLDQLSQPYQSDANVRLALANGAAVAGESTRAASEARAALELAPDSERAVITAAQYLQRDDRAAALKLVEEFLARKPDANDVRLAYARLLIADEKYSDARIQFEQLVKSDAHNPDTLYALSLLSLQAGMRPEARTYLERYLALIDEDGDERDPAPAYIHMAQISEEEKKFAEALTWLRKVNGGDQYLLARVREASVLAKTNRLDEGRRVLHEATTQNSEERTQLVLSESQLLRDNKHYKESYEVLSKALEKSPDDAALLYDTAMAAEKLDRMDVMEKHLRKLIELKPDNAQAYNALGYSLADRNQRLPEALTLIEKANALLPKDPYIIDSLGWVEYRLGNLGKAREYLQQAYDAKPEAEVGMHLAEVVWVQGDQDAARKLLRDVRVKEPDNTVLKSTLARLKIRL